MDNNQSNETPADQQQPLEPAPSSQSEEESFGWRFHRLPLFVAFMMTIIFYILVFLFTDTSTGPMGR